ncbi:MAG: hypothetical protein ACFFAN_13235 [Promethearchaeota archaeon]
MNEILKIENERAKFKELIASNPNYFGNIKDKATIAKYSSESVTTNNTSKEELLCVGFYPERDLLEAVLEIKVPSGFYGPLCSMGSKEYVAFYVDYNDGAGFIKIGAPAVVNVHDLSFINKGEHVFYAVRKNFIPKEYWPCDKPQIVKVRAILSWEAIPTSFDYQPVFGNVIDVWIQIRPKLPLIPILDEKPLLRGDLKKIKEFVDKSIKSEYDIKEAGKLERQRLEFKELIRKNPNYFGSIIDSDKEVEIRKAITQLPKETIRKLINIPDLLKPRERFLRNTEHEELKCVGLYPEEDLLEAIIEVKSPEGFYGDLCALGTIEYVVFYIDWGSGYELAGRSMLRVHDIPFVKKNHLFYAVRSGIIDIESKLKTCTDENIVKVKAILSWEQNPLLYGPNFVPTWGNVLERYIQIRPKDGESVNCKISIVNEIHVDDISQSGANAGLALKIDEDNNLVPLIYDRPFGGIIACWGNINFNDAKYYRFLYSEDDGITWHNITDFRIARSIIPGETIIKRDPDNLGWFSKQEYNDDKGNYELTALVHWRTTGKNGDYLLRLELANLNKVKIAGQEYDVYLKLDNLNPELFWFGETPEMLPAKGITVKDKDNAYKKCEEFKGEEPIIVYGNFSDDYFLKLSLLVFGGNIDVHGKDIGSIRYDSGEPGIGETGILGAHDGGLGLQIASLDLCTIDQDPKRVKCAYGIRLSLLDRAIVGYMSGYAFDTTSHSNHGFITFNWTPAGCPPPP